MELRLPERVLRVIAEEARRRGTTLEGVIIEKFVEGLDPGSRVEVYMELFERYLSDAEESFREGDLPQAGEKYWGAVTALLNAIGELEGLPHYSHRDYVDIVEHLAEKYNDPEISTLFGLAERLHANFYHNFLRRRTFERHREGVLLLIEKLKSVIKSPTRGG
ncbi:MAG: PaREP1 family protein [Candidatus Baldrarchaeia archaeon]